MEAGVVVEDRFRFADLPLDACCGTEQCRDEIGPREGGQLAIRMLGDGTMLRSYGDIRTHIHARYSVETSEERWLRLVWTFPRGEGEEPSVQTVEVTTTKGHGSDWVRLLSVLAARDEVDLERCMRANFNLVVGTVALFENLLVLRHHLRLPLATPDELDEAVQLVPRVAVKLRADLALEYGWSAAFRDYED